MDSHPRKRKKPIKRNTPNYSRSTRRNDRKRRRNTPATGERGSVELTRLRPEECLARPPRPHGSGNNLAITIDGATVFATVMESIFWKFWLLPIYMLLSAQPSPDKNELKERLKLAKVLLDNYAHENDTLR